MLALRLNGKRKELTEVNLWMEEQKLPKGILSFDFTDMESGEQKAIFDLAWPEGIQKGLSQPVAY